MKVASAGSADDEPAAGAAEPAVAKPAAQPAASRGSRGKARKPVYVDSDRWETLILPLQSRIESMAALLSLHRPCLLGAGSQCIAR